jgi:NTE family protein
MGKARAAKLSEGWDCRNLSLQVAKVSFDQMRKPGVKARLDKIPTRKLPKDDVDLLIASAGSLLRQNSSYKEFLATY